MTKAVTLANLASGEALTVDETNDRVGIASTAPSASVDVKQTILLDGNSGVVTATSFVGDGSSLTGIANTAIIAANQLTVTGVVTAASFVGDGSALTGVANTDFVVSTATTTARLVVTNGVNVSGITTTGGLSNTITSGNVIALMDSTNNSQNHRVRINSQGTSSSTSLAISNSNANNQSSIVHGSDGGLTIRSDQTAGAEPTTGTAKITIDGTSGNVSIGATLQIGIGKSINFGNTQKAFVQEHAVGVGTTTTTGRNAGLGTAAGTIIFNSDTAQLQVYDGNAWRRAAGDAISATGGSKDTTTRTGFAVHTFTGSGSLTISSGVGDIEYVIYGGGAGGGGHAAGGGGGAGGVMSGTIPLLGPGAYTVTVGPGGGGGPTSQPATGTDGGNSSIAVPSPKGGTIIAYGGGGGGDASTGENGGCGGGGPGTQPQDGGYGFNPTTPAPNLNPALAPLHPYPITQGGNGARRQAAPDNLGGGGGGTGGGSHPTNAVDAVSGDGGPGTTFTITGASVTKGGGGGAGAHASGESGGEGGSGGGADGSPQGPNSQAPSASANTASGGGGGGGTQGVNPSSGGDGGSGIIYIAYEV